MPPMKIDEETLMAFADGKLSGPQADAVASAVAGDPALAGKVAQHLQLRETMAAAFAPVLDEPVPPSLAAAVSASAGDTPGKVVDFGVERRSKAIRRTPFIQRWGSIAAALVVGLFAGQLVDLRSEEQPSELQSLMRISYAVFCLKKKHKDNH